MSFHKEVLSFINRFTDNGKNQGVIDCFTHGCCFWFAEILYDRFSDWDHEVDIMYDEIVGHFACAINGRIYDITGELPNNGEWKWTRWMDLLFTDPDHGDRILQDCVRF